MTASGRGRRRVLAHSSSLPNHDSVSYCPGPAMAGLAGFEAGNGWGVVRGLVAGATGVIGGGPGGGVGAAGGGGTPVAPPGGGGGGGGGPRGPPGAPRGPVAVGP